MKHITVMGANAARQKTLLFDSFVYGEVNRAGEMLVFPAGKGINFCRAAKCYGKIKSTLIQFAGGENGAYIADHLLKEGIHTVNIRTVNPTRCCITCLDKSAGVMTEVIEPSFPVSAEEADAFIHEFITSLSNSAGAAICGSLPDGTDPELYLRAGNAALDAGLPLLLDVCKNIDPLLARGKNVILKINKDELAKLSGITGIVAGLKKLFDKFPLQYAAITDGPGKAYACDGKTVTVYELPKLDGVINPIGCGDTASGVLLSDLCSGAGIFEAFKNALACASANALSICPGSFDTAQSEDVCRKIKAQTFPLNSYNGDSL